MGGGNVVWCGMGWGDAWGEDEVEVCTPGGGGRGGRTRGEGDRWKPEFVLYSWVESAEESCHL